MREVPRSRFLLLLSCLLLAALGCGGKKNFQAPCEYPYGKEAVDVELAASAELNTYNGQPHTVLVVLYQLTDPNRFQQLLESQAGVGRLLDGEPFDASVVSNRQLVVQPGELNQLRMDRVEGARYLGIVAGFYNQQAQNFSRLYPIPTRVDRSFFGKEKRCYPTPLTLSLRLGSDGFGGVQGAPPSGAR